MAEQVLVVEDSPTQLEALRMLLTEAGVDVLTARNGDEALEVAHRLRPAVVLTDVVMPGMSGLDLCRRIKDEMGDEAPAVVLITGLSDPRDIVLGLSSGADNYISKPYEADDVISRVRWMLENRALKQDEGHPEGLRVRFMGEDLTLDAEPERMLGMLLGSFEELARTNRALRDSRHALAEAAARELQREQAMRSEAERTAETMARLVETAEAATRARDDVLATVSHDLKNPVGTIYTSSSLLLEMELNPENIERQLQIIRRTAERMDRLIQDLLDVSKMEAGHFSVAPSPVAAGVLLQEAHEMLEPLATARSLRFVNADDSDGARVLADEERLQRVFSNLIGNALKFTRPSGTITLRALAVGKTVEFSVTDEGPGIPAEHLEHVFDRFWQAAGTARQGSGLGLAIARGIVEAHRGSIWAESDPPNGTTFFFALPRVE